MDKYFEFVIDVEGRPISDLSVQITNAATGDMTIYSDDGVTVKQNPFLTDSAGYFEFYAADGKYDIQFSGANVLTTTLTDVNLLDGEGITANAEAISILKSQVGDPDQPNSPNEFIFSIADNTTVGSIAQIPDETFTHWKVVEDSTTQPTSGWTAGTTIVSAYDLVTWTSKTLYLWIRDDNAGGAVTQIEPAVTDPRHDGESTPGLIVKATDTLAPVWNAATSSFTCSTAGAWEIVTIPVDSGSGLSSTPYNIYVDEVTVVTDTADTSGTINLLPRTDPYIVKASSKDQFGNESFSTGVSVTVAVDSLGLVAVNDTDLELTFVEDPAAHQTVPFTRTGGSGTAYITYTTIDDTAVAGTNYQPRKSYTITGDLDGDGSTTTATIGQVGVGKGVAVDDYIWVQGASDANANGYFTVATRTDDEITYTANGVLAAGADAGSPITVHTGVLHWSSTNTAPTEAATVLTIDNTEATNKQFYVVVDWDTRSTADVDLDAESVRVLITGSGNTSDTGFQSGGDHDWVVTEIENDNAYVTQVNATYPGQTSDVWEDDIENGTSGRYSNGWHIDAAASNDYGNASCIDIRAPYNNVPIAITGTADGQYDLYIRGRANVSQYARTHCALLRGVTDIGADDSGGAGNQLVTCAAAHGYVIGDEIYFESDGTTAYDLTVAKMGGTTTAGNATTFTDSNANGGSGWTTDELVGRYAHNLTNSEKARITANTGTVVTVTTTSGWAASNEYYIGGYDVIAESGATFDIKNTGLGAETSLTDMWCFGEETLMNWSTTPDGSNSPWEWQLPTDADSHAIKTNISATGAYHLRFYIRQGSYYAKYDRMCLVPNSKSIDIGTDLDVGTASSSGIDMAFGPTESTYDAGSGGSTSDDADNNPRLVAPLPTTEYTMQPSEKFPATGSSDINLSTIVKAEFDGLTNLRVNDFYVTYVGSGSKVEGTFTLTENSIQFNPTSPLTAGQQYSVTLEGRITEGTTGKSIVDGTWTFTTVATVDADVYADFNGVRPDSSVDYQIAADGSSDAILNNQFAINGVTTNFTDTSVLNGEHYLVDDPLGTGRGTVLKVREHEGATGYTTPDNVRSGMILYLNNSGMSSTRDFELSYDVFVPVGYRHSYDAHWHGLLTKPFDGNVGRDYVNKPEKKDTQIAVTCNISGTFNDSNTETTNKYTDYPGTMAVYYYTTSLSWRRLFLNKADPTAYYNLNCLGAPEENLAIITPGEWHNFKVEAHANDNGSSNGVLKAWHNGVLGIDISDMTWISPAGYTNGVTWDSIQFHKWWGGWQCMANQYIYYDNFIYKDLT